MVVALLCRLAGTTTGMQLYGVEENTGPLAISAPQVQSVSVISKAQAEDDDEDEENLVKAMLTGKKEVDDTYQ